MAWSGYFMFGGTELMNATRTEAYAKHFNVGWFRPIYNEVALSWLLGENRYTTPLQDDAPWTDPDNLDSYDFYGVYPLEVTGIEDGTTDATVVESVIDGGYIGRTRKKTRTVVFSAVLTGASECAVEYGHRWLRSVLTGGPCFNQAYGQCGGVDLCYLSCPPVISEVEPTYSPGEPALDSRNFASNPGGEILGSQGWNPNNAAHHVMSVDATAPISNTKSILSTRQAGVIGTNLADTPNFEDGLPGGWTSGTAARYPLTVDSTAPISGTKSIMSTRTADTPNTYAVALTARQRSLTRFSVTAGKIYTWAADARTELAGRKCWSQVTYFDAAGAQVGVSGYVTHTTSSVAGQVFRIAQTFLTPANAVTAQWTMEVFVTAGGTTTGERVWFDNFVMREGSDGTYFDGDTGSALTHRWTGTAHNSTSEQVAASGTVKRTNIAANPIADGVNTTTWWSPTRVTHAVDAGFLRMTVNDATVNDNAQRLTTATGGANQIAVTPGQTLRVAGQVRSSASWPMHCIIQWLDASQVFLSQVKSQVGATNPSTWTDLSVTGVPPATAAFAVVQFGIDGLGPRVIGETFDVRHVVVEKATSGAYFDGSSAAIPASNPAGTSYRWTGTPNASTSEKVGVADAEVASIYIAPSNQPVPVVPGVPVTVAVDVKVEQANRKVYGYLAWLGSGGATPSVEIPAGAPGEVVRLVLTGTPPPGATGVYPIAAAFTTTGVALVGERVWFDNLYIGGDPSGDYFDGASSPSNPYTYAWAGTPHASGSYRYKDTWVQDPDPTAEDCYSRIGRSLHEVTTTVGPTVTQKLEMNDGGAAWQVTWTMVAANPAEFGVEKPLVVGFLDPAVEIPYYGGILPPGGEFDEHGNVQNESPCAVPVFRPIYDPLCGLLSAPPDVPSVVPMCFSFPPNFLRTSFSIPREEIPLWTTVAPIVSLSTKTAEARSVRVRFYADMFDTGDPSQDPCNYCGDVVFSYIPPSSTIVLDCADRAVYIDQPGFGRRRADALITNSKGEPFEWPEFSCGYGYVVTVDMPQQMTQRPILDLSLVPRMA